MVNSLGNISNVNSIQTSYILAHSQVNKTALDTHEIGTQTISPKNKEIARGAVKIVWIKEGDIKPNADGKATQNSNNRVCYTAISSFLGRKIEELKEEFRKMKAILEKLGSKKQSSDYLFLEGKELNGENRINGEYTLEVDKASCNFKEKLCSPETKLQDRVILGNHLLKGLASLDNADFAHGDLKPENYLIFQKDGKNILKLSDFGKAKELPGNKTAAYTGNTRFAPPEGVLSKKGDVYGAALILIRNFEEEYLKPTETTQTSSIYENESDSGSLMGVNENDVDQQETSLMDVHEDDFDMAASPELRGIEKYVVEHKAFLASNEGISLSKIIRRIRMSWRSESEKEGQTKALHSYIDALRQKLQNDSRFNNKAEELCNLLKKMTKANPDERISAVEAAELYEAIFTPRSPRRYVNL